MVQSVAQMKIQNPGNAKVTGLTGRENTGERERTRSQFDDACSLAEQEAGRFSPWNLSSSCRPFDPTRQNRKSHSTVVRDPWPRPSSEPYHLSRTLSTPCPWCSPTPVCRLRGVQALADTVGKPLSEVQDRVAQMHEVNPMLGFRGCRLSVVHPEITEMQARAVASAAAANKKVCIQLVYRRWAAIESLVYCARSILPGSSVSVTTECAQATRLWRLRGPKHSLFFMLREGLL